MAIPRHDAETLLRVVGEIGELGHDTCAWRAHLLESVAEHLGARVGMSLTIPLRQLEYFDALREQMTARRGYPLLGHGWSPAQQEQIAGAITNLQASGDPTLPFLSKSCHESFTVTRSQIVSDRNWYSSEHVQRSRRTSDVDSFILSQFQVPDCGVHVLGMHRAWGDKHFGERERLFLELLHKELGRLWCRHGVTGGPRVRDRLPSQLRQVFDHLCQGHAEKEMAATMNLSQHTVHDYVKELYRRLGVRGRGEFLAWLVGELRRRAAPVW